MQTGPSASRHGLDKLNLKTKGREYWNLTPPALYEEALARRRHRSPGAAPLSRSPASTPAARPTTSTSSRKPARRPGRLGQRSTSRSRPSEIRRACTRQMLAYLRRARAVRAGLLRRRRPDYRLKVRVVTENGVALAVRAQHVHPRPPATSCRISSRTSRSSTRPRCCADPEDRRHAQRHLHPGRFRQAPGADRRHLLCRRDQEIGVHAS